jgi:hypothetical protein
MTRPDIAKSFGLALSFTLLLFMTGLAVPLLGMFLLLFVPYPSLAFGMKYGRAATSWLLLAASGLLFLFGGGEVALGYLVFALMVLLLFACFGRDWPIERVIVSTATGLFVAVFAALLSRFGTLSRLRESTGLTLEENLTFNLSIYEKAGFSSEAVELIREFSSQIVQIILQILPALAFVAFVAVILINLIFLCHRFPQYRSFFFSLGDVKEWKAPEPLVWCFIFTGFCLFLPADWGIRTFALNFFLISAVFYFFQGLAIVAYFFHYKKVPVFLRGLGYVLIALEQLFTLFVVGLGLFDLWGDFRGLKKRDLNPTQVT